MPQLSLAYVGGRRFVPDELIFGVLDYKYAVGAMNFPFKFIGWGLELGFWAWYKYLGRIVTDSAHVMFTVHWGLQI